MPADRVDRIAAALEANPPDGFRGRYSREVWAVIAAAVLAASADDGPRICSGCGDIDPRHWREDGWYCEGCAACEVCSSPYCDEPEHHG